MRKRLPMTALITGLLAAPAIGGASPLLKGGEVNGMPGGAALVETFPAEMPTEVGARLRRWTKGEKLNAFGMQALHANMTLAASDRVVRAIAEMERKALDAPLVIVQYAEPATPREDTAFNAALTLVSATQVTFLGVRLVPVPDALADQLHLSHGMGMLVDMVAPDSPAEKGGLQVNDLLQKLDDQLLVNDGQIQTLVHAKKAGDVVTFTLLRGGQTIQVKVTLGEKQMVLDNPAAPAPGPARANGNAPVTRTFSSSSMTVNADGSTTRSYTDDRGNIVMTKDKNGKANFVVKDPQGKMLYEGGPDGVAKALPADLAKKATEMMEQPNEVHIELTPGGAAAGDVPGKTSTHTFTLERDDAEHQITLKVDAGGKHLTVREVAGGKTLYDGLVDNPDDLVAKGLSPAVVEKVKLALEKVK